MVEYKLNYSTVFHALADETRRDILLQVHASDKTITEIASKYPISFAAIAKHLNVMEAAALIFKRKEGRTQIISANPHTIVGITDYLHRHETLWNQRFNKLEKIAKEKS